MLVIDMVLEEYSKKLLTAEIMFLTQSNTSHCDCCVQMDFLEHAAVDDVVVMGVVLEEVRHRNSSVYQRLRALTASKTKRFFVFGNEYHRYASPSRSGGPRKHISVVSIPQEAEQSCESYGQGALVAGLRPENHGCRKFFRGPVSPQFLPLQLPHKLPNSHQYLQAL